MAVTCPPGRNANAILAYTIVGVQNWQDVSRCISIVERHNTHSNSNLGNYYAPGTVIAIHHLPCAVDAEQTGRRVDKQMIPGVFTSHARL
jgi:hypothetical protein